MFKEYSRRAQRMRERERENNEWRALGAATERVRVCIHSVRRRVSTL